jgi:hypothetical protein
VLESVIAFFKPRTIMSRKSYIVLSCEMQISP